MTATFAALLFAHVLADFVIQTRWMVLNKHRPAVFAAHGAAVLATAALATGSLHPALLALALAHLAIDAVKTFALPPRLSQGLAAFLTDQAAHLATLALVAALLPGLFGAGLWGRLGGGLPHLPPLMALAAGLILATRAGGFAIGMLMQPWAAGLIQRPDHSPGLLNGGQVIGHLERGMIFLLVLSGQAGAIGFLIAAKSVLRFGTVGDDRAASEYVIIGTLASFGWAIAVSVGTVTLMASLPPLGIPDLSP
ncbi:DUF3307 domain-containing protein [Frigidibacter oleivorans]|uniref:DUF3307 domain-containing protein n=1 Tax=Frigidibacter oleivorans TaxID=2487129 RepID=UPI000F8C95A8|nr:DUF3307 domain-containing protein [Frigidibacter oleivorans]